jgi:hypothetical protein
MRVKAMDNKSKVNFSWLDEFKDNDDYKEEDRLSDIVKKANMFKANVLTNKKANRYKLIKKACEKLKAHKQIELRRTLEDKQRVGLDYA